MLKDQVLDYLAQQGANVAQFVSYGPDGNQRFCRIKGEPPNRLFPSCYQAIQCLLEKSQSRSINIRTFLPHKPEGNPFYYGIMNASEAEAIIANHIQRGYYLIVNETINVNDGGFSGVLFGSLMECAPNETPRCVDKYPDCLRLPRDIGFDLIHKVYGFHFHMPFSKRHRVEFSIHPYRVGYLNDFQIIWQVDEYKKEALPLKPPKIIWPNRYSRAMGDKAFGLLIADLLGLPVPQTTVFGRIIPPFTFGSKTGSKEPVWVRTAPKKQIPGLFKTARGWIDPFEILQKEDPDNTKIAAILIQEGVAAQYSGSAITDKSGKILIEGCKGYGDKFMIGSQPPESLPKRVIGEVTFVYERAKEKLGDIRFEWVYDGEKVWILQLHVGKTETKGFVVYPGTPRRWIEFNARDGLKAFRQVVKKVKQKNLGIILRGNVGLTSHFGDILRKNRVPSRLEK